jgi:hypothetical protein
LGWDVLKLRLRFHERPFIPPCLEMLEVFTLGKI